MDKRNLSELFDFGMISRMTNGVRWYWCGENEWSLNRTADSIVIRGMDQLLINQAWIKEIYGHSTITLGCDYQISLMQWGDGVWVVLNPQTMNFHRVSYIGTHGEGYYFQDEGTTERVLVVRRNADFWTHVTIRGMNLIEAMAKSLEGDELRVQGFNIDSASNMRFQFEYETEEFKG